MTNLTSEKSLKKTVRIAGFMFLLILFVPLFNWIFILSKFISTENVINTTHNIMTNEFLFRMSIIIQLITSIFIVILAVALYIILKPVNKNIALFAFSLKLIEAILWVFLALSHFIALLIMNGQASLKVIKPEQMQTLIGFFINMYISLTAIPGVFSGLNLLIFSYLLFKSKYIPNILAALGILSYALTFIYDSLTILSPNYSTMIIIQIIFCAPICFFQMTIGIWLILRGVKVPQIDNHSQVAS